MRHKGNKIMRGREGTAEYFAHLLKGVAKIVLYLSTINEGSVLKLTVYKPHGYPVITERAHFSHATQNQGQSVRFREVPKSADHYMLYTFGFIPL